MTRYSIKLLSVVIALGVASSALAQDWPKPSKSQNTPVKCVVATNPPCSKGPDLLTAGYSDPIKTFTGRFLDSQATREWQNNPRRTLRARLVRINTERDRIYMMLGATLASYKLSTFFTRLESGEAMTSLFGRPGTPEQYLVWGSNIYPELSAEWQVSVTDGQDRLFNLDSDDRGYVYPAYSSFGWGAVYDDPAIGLQTKFQAPPGGTDPSVFNIISVKSSNGTYYVIASPNDNSNSKVWNVGTSSTFVHEPVGTIKSAIWQWAKAEGGAKIGTIDNDGRVRIYTNDGIIGGNAIVNFKTTDISGLAVGYGFTALDSDGTNFYVLCTKLGEPARMIVFYPSGGSYSYKFVQMGSDPPVYYGNAGVRWGGGHLTVFGPEAAGSDLRVFKTGPDGSLSELLLNRFFARYYSRPESTNYITPNQSQLYPVPPGADALVHKIGGKTYLIASAVGLGDVYELAAGDSITGRVKSVGAGVNPNSLQAGGTGPFYGDKFTFTSSSSAAVPPSVNWNFGDGVQQTAPAGAPDIPHQFIGLNAGLLPAVKTVIASSASDALVKDQFNVTLARPTVRVQVKNHPELLWLQPDLSSPAPIVTSDEFVDASDGALEGHYDDWSIDGTVTKVIPSGSVAVGGCGVHTLNYTAHYGPVDQTNFTFTAANSDATFAINPIVYNSKPYTVDVAAPVASGATDLLFAPQIRTTTRTADLPGGAATAATYLWELLNSNGTVNTTLPANGTPAAATLATIPSFVVAKSKFGAAAMQVRLSVEVASTAACGFAKQSQLMTGLAGPSANATLQMTGCTNINSPCSFAVTAANPQSNWKYDWTVTGPGTFTYSGTGSSFATWSPALTVAGAYTMNVVVSNAIGTQTLNPLPFTLAAPLCATAPTTFNTSLNYSGASSGCLDAFTTCTAGETINFVASPFGWSFGGCETFDWDFGDGSTHGTSASVSHTYANNGTYDVKLFIVGGSGTKADLSKTLKVGPTTGGGGGNTGGGGGNTGGGGGNTGGGTGGCSPMLTDSVYVTYYGATSNCTPAFGACQPNEGLGFEAYGQNGYNINCTSHTYSWSFGDGGSSNLKSPTHVYASPGTYNVQVVVGNGSTSLAFNKQVVIGTGSNGGGGNNNGGGGSCPQITTANVTPSYSNSDSACKVGGTCPPNQAINFTAALSNYSGSNCPLSTYIWLFGDNSQPSTSAAPQHTYSAAGDYTVTLTVANGANPVAINFLVHVAPTNNGGGGNNNGGGCPTLTNDNVYFSWYGDQSACTPNLGDCKDTENVGFQVFSSPGLFGCAPHTFTWDFKDGSDPGTGQTINHRFRSAGTYDVEVLITNTAGGSIRLTRRVKVANESGVTPVPGARRRPTKH